MSILLLYHLAAHDLWRCSRMALGTGRVIAAGSRAEFGCRISKGNDALCTGEKWCRFSESRPPASARLAVQRTIRYACPVHLRTYQESHRTYNLRMRLAQDQAGGLGLRPLGPVHPDPIGHHVVWLPGGISRIFSRIAARDTHRFACSPRAWHAILAGSSNAPTPVVRL